MEISDKHKEADAFVNNIFMQTPVAILILLGKNYEVALANELYMQLVDKTQDFVGKPFFEVLPELKTQGIQELLDQVMLTGITYHGKELELHLWRKHKLEQCFFDFTYHPKRDYEHAIIGVIVVAIEVTNQVITRNKKEMQELMVNDLLMTAPGFICTLDGPDHVYGLVNVKYQQLFGKRKIQGKPLMEALPELAGQGFDTLLDKVYNTGEPYAGIDIPITMARDENQEPEVGYYNFSYQPIYDENKKIVSILVFGYEVTEQMIAKIKNLENQKIHANELEEKVHKRTLELNALNIILRKKNDELEIAHGKILSNYSRNLIEASLDPLITISAEGKITDLNEAFAIITCEAREKLIGADFGRYFTDPEKAREVYREVFAKGFVTNYPLTIIDGELTDVLFNGSVYKDENGEVKGAVVVARDITEQKKYEKELTEANVLAELARALAEEAKMKAETATAEAKLAVKAKQQFLSNMSHEIRTPMNAIIGFTKVVLKTELTGKQREYLSAIKISGESLIVLINDILDLAKVDAGKMSFEIAPFKIAFSISAMLHLFETKIQEKNLTLIKNYDPEIPTVLMGDSVRLNQILLNLLSNAVKFTSEGKITVDIKLLHQDANQATIVFAITDTGIGIPANEIENIFENFQQASNDTTRLYGGTGLGLAIVKNLVEAQGGSISVNSKINEGSTFSFVLGFQKTEADATLETEILVIDAEITNLKVLVAEDMPLNQLLMKTLLDDFGFESDIVDNGKLAVEKLEKGSYDIVLMDLQMPEMNGFEATEYIRTTLNLQIPIMALTADVTTVDVAKCKAVGMNDYISKPVDEKILYSKIVALTKTAKTISLANSKKTQINRAMKYVNLDYLNKRTKSNPKLMRDMILLYLEQTPPLIAAMKQSLALQDWKALRTVSHKIIPSFSIMGISTDFENMAKKVQEFSSSQVQVEEIQEIVTQLETVCLQACEELEAELELINKSLT